jgi:Gas vesicle protein
MPVTQSEHDRLPDDLAAQRIALVDLLDRVLAEGVVVTGEITLSIADVDLVTVSLRALLASVGALAGQAGQAEPRGAR